MKMLKVRNIVFPALLLWLSYSYRIVHCDDNLLVTIEEVPEPGSNTSVVGPPGPVGLIGPPGPKGTTGRIGTCKCDIERVQQQKTVMNKIKATKHYFSATQRVAFNFKQNPDLCSVGIKTGQLPNSAMTASSTGDHDYAPYFARLDNMSDNKTNRGIWVPVQGLDENWLQVNLTQPTKITGIITQGYQHYDLWISTFKISYGNLTSELNFIQEGGRDKIFVGNHDRASYKFNLFPQPITAKYFRLYVVTYETVIVLRMELLTC